MFFPYHKKSIRSLLGVFLLGIGAGSLLFAYPSFAFEEDENWREIWLEPAYQDANATKGNWGVAKLDELGETHLSFHVPHDFDKDADPSKNAPIVVVIPVATGNLLYAVQISVARNGQLHFEKSDAYEASIPVHNGELTEIKIESHLLEELEPSDYVTVNFKITGGAGVF